MNKAIPLEFTLSFLQQYLAKYPICNILDRENYANSSVILGLEIHIKNSLNPNKWHKTIYVDSELPALPKVSLVTSIFLESLLHFNSSISQHKSLQKHPSVEFLRTQAGTLASLQLLLDHLLQLNISVVSFQLRIKDKNISNLQSSHLRLIYWRHLTNSLLCLLLLRCLLD